MIKLLKEHYNESNMINNLCEFMYDNYIKESDYGYNVGYNNVGFYNVDEIEIPDFEEVDSEFYDVIDEDIYNEAREKLIDLLRNVKYYDGYIQLSDNRTFYNIDADISDDDMYTVELVLESVKKEFEDRNKVKVYLLGRSNRHVCVEDNFDNVCRYADLVEEAERAEEKFINRINEMYSE